MSYQESSETKFESVDDVLKRIFGTGQSVGAELASESSRYKAIKAVEFSRPTATRTIAVSNQKGGVGKTTSAVNLAAAFAETGMQVLVIDMDPQGNASTAFGIDHKSGTSSIYDVLEGREKMADVVRTCPDFPTLDVVPSTIDLSGAELEIASMDNRVNLLKMALNDYLAQANKKYDYVFIDCAPSLGLLVLNALNAVQEVLIPIQAEYYALEGLGQLLKTIQLVQANYNKNLQLSTMLVTMFDRRTSLSHEVYDEVKKYYPKALLKTVIPRSVRISEAPSYAQSVITYEPRSSGAIAYREAAFEIAKRGKTTESAVETSGDNSAAE